MQGAILTTIGAVLITVAFLVETGFGTFTSAAVIIYWLVAGDAWYRFRKQRTRESLGQDRDVA
jgi:hypothetical protein